jgi:D-alanyl-D-alanine carboxypeptidase
LLDAVVDKKPVNGTYPSSRLLRYLTTSSGELHILYTGGIDMIRHKSYVILSIIILFLCGVAANSSHNKGNQGTSIPNEIQQIMKNPFYEGAIWGLRVVDFDTGELVYDLNPDTLFLMGSIRKIFTIGEALNEFGADFRFRTPVHRLGEISKNGVLNGDLILVARGDLTMGGRIAPDGSMSIPNLDHNEANALGNAQLPNADPLAGYNYLAQQVVGAGITEIHGDVIIDDRLFEPFIEFHLKRFALDHEVRTD